MCGQPAAVLTQRNLFDANYGNRIPPDICSSKHGGNAESVEANGRVDKRQGQRDVIATLTNARLTSKEIAVRLGKPLNCISGRLSELKMAGVIMPTGVRRDGSAELRLI